MVYTSGIRLSETDSLESLQNQKIDLVCQKIHLKKGDRMLDIGCGWGTLAIRATKLYEVCVCRVCVVCLCVSHVRYCLPVCSCVVVRLHWYYTSFIVLLCFVSSLLLLLC